MSDAPSHDGMALTEADLGPDPIAGLVAWLDGARAAGVRFPEAAALATADAQGRPAVRHVLVKAIDERGLAFFTNRDSRKGRHLAENPDAAVAFYWRELDRQVCVTGTASPVDDAAFAEIAERFPGDDVPLPPHWGGYRLEPETIEFWQGREHRLHDRFRFTREGDTWRVERLWP